MNVRGMAEIVVIVVITAIVERIELVRASVAALHRANAILSLNELVALSRVHVHVLLLMCTARIERDMERDARTVFVFNLPLRVTDRELYRFFEKAGRVNDIRLIHDRNTRRSKGMGYVEYRDKGCVTKAMQKLSGQVLKSQTVVIQPTQAEKNHEALKEYVLRCVRCVRCALCAVCADCATGRFSRKRLLINPQADRARFMLVRCLRRLENAS